MNSMRIETARIPLAGMQGMSEAIVARPCDDLARPCILVRTPYPRLSALNDNAGLELAARGYAVVVQSSRGRHGSDGRFRPFLDEVEDGIVAIAWCLQQSWCDGRIFLSGKSYEGFAAWAAASRAGDELVGLTISMTASRPLAWFYEGGAFRHSFAQSWGLSLAYTDPRLSRAAFERVREYARDLAGLYEIAPDASPLLEVLPCYELWLSQAGLAAIGENFVTGRRAPAHVISGWNDIFLRGTLNDLSRETREGDRFIVGPWSHDSQGMRIVGQTDYGVESTTGEFDLFDDRLAWMKSVLDACPQSAGSFYSLLDRRWLSSTHWPPSTSTYTIDLKCGHGRRHSYTALDRSERMMSPGGRVHQPTLPIAGGFRFDDVNRAPSTMFVSDTLAAATVIAGTVRIVLDIRSSDRFLLMGWLFVRVPDGTNYPLASGAMLVKDAGAKRVFEFSETTSLLPKGSRLTAVFATSSWPEFYSPPASLPHSDSAVCDLAQLELPVLAGEWAS